MAISTGKIATSHHVAALLVVLAIDTRARTTINESTRRGWPTDFPPVCTMDTACMRDVEDAVPYAKDAVLS